MVAADIVEVAPAYDGTGEQTALVASQIGYEILTSMVGLGLRKMKEADGQEKQPGDADRSKDEL